jgi:hypothetical protein
MQRRGHHSGLRAAVSALLSVAVVPSLPPLARATHRHFKAPAPQSAHRSTAAAARCYVGAGGASEGRWRGRIVRGGRALRRSHCRCAHIVLRISGRALLQKRLRSLRVALPCRIVERSPSILRHDTAEGGQEGAQQRRKIAGAQRRRISDAGSDPTGSVWTITNHRNESQPNI